MVGLFGSFDRAHILKHLDGVFEPFIHELHMRGMRLPDLFARHNLGHIDLLHVDTEGYDFKILCQLADTHIDPSLILYEHIHLSLEERQQAVAFLQGNYHLFYLGCDILAVSRALRGVDERTLRPIQRYRVTANE